LDLLVSIVVVDMPIYFSNNSFHKLIGIWLS
jgi:hypothetical protein